MIRRPCGNFKKNYIQDEGIFPTRLLKIVTVLFILLLFALPLLPWLISDYLLYVAITVLITVIGALGMNIITGYAGQISVAHGAFIGIGAYTCGILANRLGISLWLTIPAAGVTTAVVGVLFGSPSLRLKGLYLLMATLAAQFFLVDYVFMEWESMTKGAAMMELERPSVFGFALTNDRHFYYLPLIIAIAATFFTMNLFRTKVGRAFIAMRDRDLAAELIGIDLFRHKLIAFAISSFYAGVCGALYAYFWTLINPQAFGLFLSIQYLAIIICGGMGSVRGSILGAVFIVALPQIVKNFVIVVTPLIPAAIPIGNIFAGLETLLFGLVIVLFLIIEPEGLNKMWYNFRASINLWPFSY